ncbi:imidazolonepropionase, partial [Streptomyces albidoflavus]
MVQSSTYGNGGGQGGSTAVVGISSLVTNDPAQGGGSPLGVIRDAALVMEGDRVP